MTVNWQPAPKKFSRFSVFTEIHGDIQTGKTCLALTAPGPIAFITTGEKVPGVIEPFANIKDISMTEFAASFSSFKEEKDKRKDIMSQASVMMDLVEEAWIEGVSCGKFRTLIIDCHCDVYLLLRYGMFGSYNFLSGRIDAAYGPVNDRWFTLLNSFRKQFTNLKQGSRGTNLILVGRTEDTFPKSSVTVPVWQKFVPGKADIILRTSENKGKYSAKVYKGWMNSAAKGKDYNINLDLTKTGGLEALPLIWSNITKTNVADWM